MKSEESTGLPRVGVRELRQNLSVYLDRVKEGARLEVTEHGQPVALLVPLPPEDDALARLIAEGRVIPATRDLSRVLREHPPLPAIPGAKPLSRVIEEMREEETF